jgi:excisionase family DNA binding protein
MSAVARPRPPRVALSVEEACASLGVSWDFWRANIEPEIRVVRIGRRKLIAVAELERWLAEHGEAVRPDPSTPRAAIPPTPRRAVPPGADLKR